MTKHGIDRLKEAACSVSPNHGLTLIEIQRWEDDGGAIPAGPNGLRQRRERPHELAAAE